MGGTVDDDILPGHTGYEDAPNAVVRMLDTGHFALETHVEEVAHTTKQFLR